MLCFFFFFFNVLGPLCSLPFLSVAHHAPQAGIIFSSGQDGEGPSGCLTCLALHGQLVKGTASPSPKSVPAQVHKQAVHHQHWCTLWLQLISQWIEFSGPSPCDYVTGVPLPVVSSFTVALLWKSLGSECGGDRDMATGLPHTYVTSH